MYSTDKIKSVHILAKPEKAESEKNSIATVIVQFWHSIFSVSLSGSNTRRLSEFGKMVPEFTVQSHLNKVFFAERILDRSNIYMLEIS